MYKLFRFIVSGATGAAINIGSLFLLVHYAGVHYLAAAILSYILSIGFGFMLQKFWTFKDSSLSGAHFQFARFTTIALINLALNTGLMYLFVDKLHLWYLLAQFIASGLIAFESYVSYRFFVFTPSLQPESHSSLSEAE